ncbi:hypothetical protein [Phenylobacterium sp.]|uniref:hypothetical protein n=1 Tax=Phenylobacterium sp. TaxID=1871053 RepID=UPI00272FEDC6|nr:hypothetical protein [Phenylobacterium sp.]MDP1598980.1 hypothetical protein [Phenylobacterium sp.]MDP3590407.1 hypothetical protein [Phenylobacterium sp.]
MNAHSPIVAEETAVSFIVEQTPLAVLTSANEAEALFARIRAEIDAFVPDLSTATGRAAIKSLAFKVTKTRTAVEAARKEKTEAWRKQTDAVNASGRVIKARLEQMEDEARKPLTEWEEAEKDRVEKVANWFAAAERAVVILNDDTSEGVAERLATYEGASLDAETFGDSLERAEATRQQTVEVLRAAHGRLIQAEADRAELDRLRAESAAREEQDRLANEAAEAKEKEAADALAAKAREDEIARKAAEDATAEAARLAQNALDDQAAAHQAELDRLQKIADDKAAADAAEAEETAKRERSRAHVSKTMAAAKLAIMGLGVTEDQAREIVKAIKAGSVPNVKIQF